MYKIDPAGSSPVLVRLADQGLLTLHGLEYGGPVGRAYEQRLESKNWYERWLESKIAYEPRAKLRTSQEQNCVRAKSKIVYDPRAKMCTSPEQKCVEAKSSCLHAFSNTSLVMAVKIATCLPDSSIAICSR